MESEREILRKVKEEAAIKFTERLMNGQEGTIAMIRHPCGR
jgi:hypothetical protein